MKRVLIALAVAAMALFLANAQVVKTADSMERMFAEGGTVHLRLSPGEYSVRGGIRDRIFVHWQADNPDVTRKVKVQVDTAGSIATIRIEGSTKDAQVLIEIPARSNLHLRLRAGEVRIEGVEGNKDIQMSAGDMNIAVDPESYSRVHASVSVGELNAPAFRTSKEGFARSFEWYGSGRYTLRARLFAGELKLYALRDRS